ncbi:L-threonylcarbamoyladenylate synthase [Marinobacter halotolerans]|uniref:L-threonylcarbamoyladenylate synthase n=1 Tax=Marinobacter halotolerans TaxID=1569211 RepID=UPI001248799B|nr:L-threonylcarbamoyladenylate synthase [Marinobacter halotolerans]
MSQFFQIHPVTPQKRLINQAADILRKGGVIVFPTDSAYAIGCQLDDKQAVDRIKRIRRLDDKHNFTLMCRDLSDVGVFAKVGNTQYRLLKQFTPGAYTFILEATSEVPRRLLHPKRKTIGMRVPDNPIVQELLAELGEPIMSSTLILPGEEDPMTDPEEIRDRLEHELDLIIDGGFCGLEATTVVNMTGDVPEVTREGKGDPKPFQL